MTTTLLTEDAQDRILTALRRAFPGDPDLTMHQDGVTVRGDEQMIRIVPGQYPEHKWSFLSGLAEAEIALRDAGLKVRLEPGYAQRMLIVATPLGDRPFGYTTTNGREHQDGASILGRREDDVAWVNLTGYLYDTDADLVQVLGEARREHPDADFSRVLRRKE